MPESLHDNVIYLPVWQTKIPVAPVAPKPRAMRERREPEVRRPSSGWEPLYTGIDHARIGTNAALDLLTDDNEPDDGYVARQG